MAGKSKDYQLRVVGVRREPVGLQQLARALISIVERMSEDERQKFLASHQGSSPEGLRATSQTMRRPADEAPNDAVGAAAQPQLPLHTRRSAPVSASWTPRSTSRTECRSSSRSSVSTPRTDPAFDRQRQRSSGRCDVGRRLLTSRPLRVAMTAGLRDRRLNPPGGTLMWVRIHPGRTTGTPGTVSSWCWCPAGEIRLLFCHVDNYRLRVVREPYRPTADRAQAPQPIAASTMLAAIRRSAIPSAPDEPPAGDNPGRRTGDFRCGRPRRQHAPGRRPPPATRHDCRRVARCTAPQNARTAQLTARRSNRAGKEEGGPARACPSHCVAMRRRGRTAWGTCGGPAGRGSTGR
jgi:hypothetical protein